MFSQKISSCVVFKNEVGALTVFCSVLWVFFKQQNCSYSIIVFEHACIQELRYEVQWRRYDFQGSDHFILLCENTSNPPEVLSCYKRFICYTPPAKLVTGSTFHALFFHDVPSELWLQHQRSVLANLYICPTRHVYVVSLPSSRKQSKYKDEKDRDLAGTALVERRPQESQRRGTTEWKKQGWIKATEKHGIPGLERELRVIRSLLSSKYVEKFHVCFSGGWLIENYFQWYPLCH